MGLFKVRVPATTANLGPGFDSMGLALDLWNEARFEITREGIQVEVEGEGENELPRDGNNLIAQAAMRVYAAARREKPSGLLIQCRNEIPLGSGLGSSAAAVLAGLLGGNALLGEPLSERQILDLAVEMEGHADNAAAALYGGLVVVVKDQNSLIVKTIKVPRLNVIVVVPNISLATEEARRGLPEMYARADVVFNLGRSVLVVEALREGNIELLAAVMEDKIHQPTRFGIIPGAEKAIAAARELGAAAALSGAGPGVAAFVKGSGEEVAKRMEAAFEGAVLQARIFMLGVADEGAEVVG